MNREELIQAVKERKPLHYIDVDMVFVPERMDDRKIYGKQHNKQSCVFVSSHDLDFCEFRLTTDEELQLFPSYKGSVEPLKGSTEEPLTEKYPYIENKDDMQGRKRGHIHNFTIALSRKAHKYFHEVKYSLESMDDGDGGDNSDVLNWCLETLSDFEERKGYDLLHWLTHEDGSASPLEPLHETAVTDEELLKRYWKEGTGSGGAAYADLIDFSKWLRSQLLPPSPKLYEINFDGHVRAQLLFDDDKLQMVAAMDGYGNGIESGNVSVELLPSPIKLPNETRSRLLPSNSENAIAFGKWLRNVDERVLRHNATEDLYKQFISLPSPPTTDKSK